MAQCVGDIAYNIAMHTTQLYNQQFRYFTQDPGNHESFTQDPIAWEIWIFYIKISHQESNNKHDTQTKDAQ